MTHRASTCLTPVTFGWYISLKILGISLLDMLKPPISPMLAKPTQQIPEGDFIYEPKWDGFRAIVFRSKAGVTIGSRGEKELTRYFPELVTAFESQLSPGTVLDGEIVVPNGHVLDFSLLQQRIHPALSRVTRLAQETPAHFVAFDLLQFGNKVLSLSPFLDRRRRLEELAKGFKPPIHLTTSTTDIDQARRWFAQFEGAGLDGVMAKRMDSTYQPGEREMLKIKHFRSADCVVAGYRPHKSQANAVGALLLGLYDDTARLQYVGSTSSFASEARREMAGILEVLRTDTHPWLTPNSEQRVPGAISRWSGKKDLSFIALHPELVCEVRYDQLEGERFRHTTTFIRWRPDREPESCTYSQLDIPAPYDLSEVMS